ncbi:TraB family protein [Roseovarius albus]|uniref:TraB family protein n=1 Tax=Roseovarius albus TaxID=1247867 RepID=A0A1X6Z0K5_9RHOB|nr:TraB/GumN family protein [Roseovarius albus]SLN37172.1 TraB family protein [Roseovarius albus]
MRRLIAAVLFAVSPQFAMAQAECTGIDLIATLPANELAELEKQATALPYPEGIFWKATKGARSITIFGTYHFSHAQTQAHLEALKPVITEADAIYLEISNDKQDQMAREMADDPSMMFITEGPTLVDMLSEAEWQSYSQQMTDRAIPSFMAAKFKPLWASMMLGIGPCEMRNGAMEGGGIDTLIGDYAAELGNPSRSLEDFRVLMGMLDDLPQEDQLDMIRLSLDLPFSADDLSYTLKAQYLEQNIALLWEYSRKISIEQGDEGAEEDFALLEEKMLTRRNHDWIEVLTDPALPVQVFVAFGAGHLPGKNGVLYLLEAQGYAIERLSL